MTLPSFATVFVARVTDLTTSAVLSVRQLSGNKGVSIGVIIDVGKTPPLALLVNITSALALPSVVAALGGRAIASLAAATGLPASYFSASVSAPAVANSPFVLASPAAAFAVSGDSGSGSGSGGGGAIGGAIGGVLVFVLAVCELLAEAHPCAREFRARARARRPHS